MVGAIYEVVQLVGSPCGSQFTTVTTSTLPQATTTAIATSAGDIVIFDHRNGQSTTKRIPWTQEENRRPVSLAFSPTAEWLCVASEDGTLFVVPISSHLEPNSACDHRFRTDDVLVLPPNGSRARPTALVWWQTVVGDVSLAIVGTELGELSFIELISGREVGGTYINVPVRELHLCRDNSLDTVFLLITGPDDRQWRLVLEQRSTQYLFPLEHISPEWAHNDSSGESFHGAGSHPPPAPRSRLLGLKQMSVEKLQMIRQKLSEAKTGTRRRPQTENKGVDTCDIDEVMYTSTPEHTMTASITSTTSGNDNNEPAAFIPSQPESMGKYVLDSLAIPQYAKERYLLACHCKENSTVLVYSTDLESTPLYVFKIVPNINRIVLHDEMIFMSDAIDRRKVTIISTFFSSSSKLDGSLDSKVNPIIQEVELPEGQEIIGLFSTPAFKKYSQPLPTLNNERDEALSVEDEELSRTSHTWPSGCLIVTKSALYICQTRSSIESLFMELVLKLSDIDSANKLGVIFSLDPKLFELAADIKLRSRNFAAAIALYKHSRCPHVKCSIKFAAQGLVNEFLTYQGTLTTGVSGPDLGLEERRNLATLAILCHLQQLCAPPHQNPPTTQHQHALRNLLIFLRENHYYDEVVALSFMAGCWRWESLQYLTTARGLHLEKLQALLSKQMSPIIDALVSNSHIDPTKLPLTREREAGYLYCISDPELRQVLLLCPNIAHKHMSLVLRMLPNLEVSILSRLADLYNPSHPAIKAFLNLGPSKKHQGYPMLSSFANGSTGFLSYCDEIISFDAFIEVFLTIIIKLNEKRRWNYIPSLLSKDIELPNEVPNTPVELIVSNVISGGFSHSAVIIGEALYTWGLPDYGVLGHGPHSTSNNKLLQGISLLLNQQEDMLNSNNGSRGFLSSSGIVPSVIGDVNNIVNDGSEPRRVSFFSHHKVFSVTTGKNHMLAITNQGVYGWGSSKYGQVGCGGTSRYPRPSLIMELEGKNVVAVACGQFHSLAVTKDGKLYTWGWGVHGQLGHGNVEDQQRPTLVKKLKNKHIVVACGGYAHSVAMTSDGKVYAWGCGTYGQCGNGGIQKINKPMKVHLPGFATHLAAGYFQNIAVTRDNVVYTWGSNPACLRVQAQLQRRARMQQAEQHKRNGSQNPYFPQVKRDVTQNPEFSQVKDFQRSKEENKRKDNLPCEEQVCTCEEDNSNSQVEGDASNLHIERDGNNSHLEEKECENNLKEMFNDSKTSLTHGAISQKEDQLDCQGDDEITTLPEDSSCKKGWNGTKPSILISPVPSPERLNDEDSENAKIKKSSNSESTDHSINESSSSSGGGPQAISANTVPSCDPNDLGHLLPRQVEMPDGFGVVRQVAAGNQHAACLTTHGALYSWGRNMSGQLGTGNRREVLAPTRILDDAYITDIACGADFTLARDSQGKVWGWGSNYYSQLGKCQNTLDDKGNSSGRVFMLRTSKRVLKVPHSVQSNCECPQIITGLPLNPIESTMNMGSQQHQPEKRWNEASVLSRLHLSDIEGAARISVSGENVSKTLTEDDDGRFGALTLHTALIHLHSIYNTNNIIKMLHECGGHQALATVYSLERQYSLAMHHQLHALFNFKQQLHQDTQSEQPTQDQDGSNQTKTSLVSEAWEILDHYLQLQTSESQVGMRGVLQVGISQWMQHALPTPQLEDLLLQHLPKTVYPLALLLFGDGTQGDVNEEPVEDPTMQVLSQLSTKFCVNLCSSVINHLQTGEVGGEYIEALSRLSGAAAGSSSTTEASGGSGSIDASGGSSGLGEDPSQQMDKILSSLAAKSTASITLSKDDVEALVSKEAISADKQEESMTESDPLSTTSQSEKATKKKDKDSVLFTCGHHFTRKEFKKSVLPQLETSVMSVPGLLGKTARVLLDQYHSEQPELACPHCVLAHLTIKITKHKTALQ